MLALISILAAGALAALLIGARRRLAALGGSERRYRALAESVPGVTIFLIDSEMRFQLLEGSAVERHGWSREALLGRRISDALPAARAAEVERLAAAALAGETVAVDWPSVREDVLFALTVGPYEERGRGVTHAICVIRDVTAEREAATEIVAQRSFLASLLGQLADRVFACDAAGRILTFDERAGELHPSLTDDLHPLEWAGSFGFMHPDGSPMGPHEAPLLRALRGETIRDVEMLVDGPEGRVALLCTGGPVTAPDGRLLGAVVTSADLTGRRETEELLRVSEERQRRVVESMTDCVFETDAEGRWTFLNQAWTLATGHEVGDSLGRRATEFVHPGDRARHFRTFEPLLRGEQGSTQLSHRFVTKDGATRWVDVRASTIAGWDGMPNGFVGVMRDITGEQRARQHTAAEQGVVRLLADADSLEHAAPRLLEALCRDLEWDCAELWRMGDDENLRRTDAWAVPDARVDGFLAAGAELAFEVGDGLPGQAWMSRAPLWRADLQADPSLGRPGEAAADGLRSGVALPLRAEDTPVGVVVLFSRTRRDPEPGLVRPFETIGAHVGQFMQRRAAERRAAEQAADLTTISGVAHALASQNDMYAARTTLVHAVRETTGASCVVLWEPSADAAQLEVSAANGAAVHGMLLPLDGSTITGTVFASGEQAFVCDVAVDSRVSPRWSEVTGAGSSAWVPVRGDGRVLGVLAVGWPGVRPALPEREAELLRLLAAEAAVTIHRTALLGSLQASARTDALTGLPNRRVWDEDLQRELERARRHGGSLCLAMLDLDRFKAFNDSRGHQAGDELLAAAATAWRPLLRATDTIARYGGEEFAVLLPHSDLEAARAVVERLLAAIPFGETASAGVAVWNGEETAKGLLARADAALYEAKGAGRARAVCAV